MSTADYMTEQERQDLRDAGRGHLIDGAPQRYRRSWEDLANLAHALWMDAEDEGAALRDLLANAYPIVCSFQCVAADATVSHSALCRKITAALTEPHRTKQTLSPEDQR